jgi:NitT/TauT family transport system ATP-binding protein
MVSAALAEASPVATTGIALDFNDVSHGYTLKGQPLPVLNRVELHVRPGEFVALLGPSGCGKSTLLRLAAGLESPSAGSVIEDGTPIDGPNPSRVLVFQDPTLFPWRTVRRNVGLGLEAQGIADAGGRRVDGALRLVRLDGFADAFPHQLSGGMAQRAALARALVNEPRLLLLDEPLGRLDSLTRLAMQGEIVSLWQRAGYTVLLVTHDVEEALLLADRVVVLSERPARIVAELTIDRPHPRHRDDPDLVRLRHKALELMGFAASW